MRISVFLFICCLCLTLQGCGKPDPVKVYPVSGTIRLNNAPVEGVNVTFQDKNSSTSYEISGHTDAQGVYSMETARMKKKGVPAGDYLVRLTKITLRPATDAEKEGNPLLEKVPEQQISTHYTRFETSGFEVKVSPSDSNLFDMNLE